MKRLNKACAIAALLFTLGSIRAFSQTSLSDLLKNQQTGTTTQSATTTTQTTTTGLGSTAGIANAVGSAFGATKKTDATPDTALPEASVRAVLAMATEDYPATPGDMYVLVYLKIMQADSLNFLVEGDGSINAGFLGKFATKGLSFRQVKAQIEKKVADSYPGSNPSLMIASTGLFPVMVKGEVLRSGLATAWGLSRLSDVITGLSTDYSSLRNVAVQSREGKTASYDLFKARRSGDLGQDPYLKPGDVVDVKKTERIVSLEGEVRRPGKYQILAGEGVSELLSYYGNGTLTSARTDLLVVTKKATAEKPEGESLVFDVGAKDVPALADGDVVRVPSGEEYLPVVYIEGVLLSVNAAVAQTTPTNLLQANPAADTAAKPADTTTMTNPQDKAAAASAKATTGTEVVYGTARVPYRAGLLLSQAAKSIAGILPPDADLEHTFISRAGDRIAVNLEKLLYSYDAANEVALKADDRVVISRTTTRAYVTGEVTKSAWVDVSGNLRLSEALKGNLTARSQIRSVMVKSRDGVEKTYDLFLANRKGDLTQDPVLKAGDAVSVSKADRIVVLEGDVKKPGSYALLPGEGISELISGYGDGALASARTTSLMVTGQASGSEAEGRSEVWDLASASTFILRDGDSVRVPSMEDDLPLVYFEGGLEGGTNVPITGLTKVDVPITTGSANVKETSPGKSAAYSGEDYSTIRVSYRAGMMLSDAARLVKDRISTKADLAAAYVIRGGNNIPVSLESILFAYDAASDFALAPNDRVILPLKPTRAFVTGEVLKSVWIPVSGKERLSEVLKDNLTTYSQTRAVKVTSLDGVEHVYDLFLADRKGDTEQDPVLRAGDRIEVDRAGRLVTLSGEVRRPGKYALLPGDGLAELVGLYGDGALASAKTDAVVVTAKATSAQTAGDSALYDLSGNAAVALRDGDDVRISSLEEYLPVVYLEGATQADGSYGIARLPYRGNMLLSQALKPMALKLPSKADLARSYVLRGSERIDVDLEKLLYTYDAKADIVLKGDDRVIIPFGQTYAYIRGEVKKAGWVDVTATSRLSMAVKDNLTAMSSVRDLSVTGTDGSTKRYDLFSAERDGDLSQDPYLRPGDVIEVKRVDKVVTISGEVRRPGTYQLLQGEGLKELIERYGDGFTEKANPSKMSIVRYVSSANPAGEKLQLNYLTSPTFAINIFDTVQVPPYQDLLPVAWFEGAIGLSGQGAAPQAAQRIPYTFFPGEMVSQAAQALRKSFSEVSDLPNAYILRKDERIAVNLSRFLYDRDDTGDQPLQPNDTIIVPFRQFFVTVSGAVTVPGRYLYVPDRTWDYYIGLAGGFDTARNAGQALTVYDVTSKVQAKDRIIQPEDNIVAAANSFTYNFYQISTILTTILSVVSIIIGLMK